MDMVRSLLIVLAVWGGTLFAAGGVPMKGAHIHEALMTNEAPITLLTALPHQPPNPLREERPAKTDEKTVWVPGYWEWSHKMNQFVWCSGHWRLPPPDHLWIAGEWKKMSAGWVRTKGFWSKVKEPSLSYIQKPPPDQLVDDKPTKPGDDYFWMSGYWKYERGKYVWYTGKWEKADKNWIYVPARYIWKEQGYVFVPAYWDWPIEYRGIAYACLTVPHGQEEISYTPDMIISHERVIQENLVCCPNYHYFYHYYYLFHPGWWWGCNWCPPWWGWDWWWFPWADQWGLWWWWGNPGFPAPWWLGEGIIIMIWGAPAELMNAMQEAMPPIILGPNGIIPPGTLIEELGGHAPVFPEDDLTDLQERGEKETEQGTTKRPGGTKPKPGKALPHPDDPMKPNAPSGARPGKQPRLPSTRPPVVVTPQKPTFPPTTRKPTPPVYEAPEKPTPNYTQPYRPRQPQTYKPRRPSRPYHPPARHYRPQPRQRRPYQPPTQSYRPPTRLSKPSTRSMRTYKPRRTTAPSTSSRSRSTMQTFK